MDKTGWLLYESESAGINKWFIEKLQRECEPFGLALKLVYTDYASEAYSLNLNGMADTLLNDMDAPAFIVNRSRNADIAYDFEKRGIRVFNPARVTEIANDKEKSYKVADTLGIPYMPYITINEEDILSMLSVIEGSHSAEPYQNLLLNSDPSLAPDAAICEYIRYVPDTDGYNSIRHMAEDFGYPFVLKPAEGHGGQHVSLITSENELLTALKSIVADHHRYPYRKLLMQRVAAVRGRDLRIYFINGEIVVGMLRTARKTDDLCANFSLGGNASMHTPDAEELLLAKELAGALPGDYMGVDFIFDKDGKPVFNEFEDVVGARMVYANTDIDMVRLFARHIGSSV